MADLPRIVITGVGLTSPNGNDLRTYRKNLLAGRSGVRPYEIRHVGPTLAGVCDFDPLRYQKKKELRRGTRAGSVAIWCAHEALADARLDPAKLDPARVGVYVGVTEHGNVETENEIHDVMGYDFDLRFWSHHHNPRTVANNPAGEVTLNLGIKSARPTASGGACAAGNLGLIHGAQMLQLGEVRPSLRRRRLREHPHLRHLRELRGRGRPREARRPDPRLPPVRQGPQRHRDLRRRAASTCSSASRTRKARGARIHGELIGHSRQLGRDRLHPARLRRPERLHPRRARERGDRARRGRPGLHAAPHPRPRATSSSAAPSARSSATPRVSTSTTPRASSATRWAVPRPWSWPATCPRSRTASCTPRSTWRTSTPDCEIKNLVAERAALRSAASKRS